MLATGLMLATDSRGRGCKTWKLGSLGRKRGREGKMSGTPTSKPPSPAACAHRG